MSRLSGSLAHMVRKEAPHTSEGAALLETGDSVVALDLGRSAGLDTGRKFGIEVRRRVDTASGHHAANGHCRAGAGGLGRGHRELEPVGSGAGRTARAGVPVTLLMSSPCRLRESGVPRGESSGRRGQATALGAAAGRAWCVDVWGARGTGESQWPLSGV